MTSTGTKDDRAAAIEEVQTVVSADGARLHLLGQDEQGVRFRLDLTDASCADCVLPPAMLTDIVQTSMRRRTGEAELTVTIEDPREA